MLALLDIEDIFSAITHNDTPMFNFFAFMASVVTILGFCSLFHMVYKRRISSSCQKKIILDMIRHLFYNCAIGEAVRLKMTAADFKLRPNDSVFAKFAFLQSDAELSRFSVNSNNFEALHQISLYIRNYNIVADVAERHFGDPAIPCDVRIAELDDLFGRAVKITSSLIDMSGKLGLGLTVQTVVDFLKMKLAVEEEACTASGGQWLKWDVDSTAIPSRAQAVAQGKFSKYKYYDDLGLTVTFNEFILNYGKTILYRPIALQP